MEKVLEGALVPQIYAISSGTTFSRPDRFHMATLKYGHVGTRQILLTSEKAMLAYVKGQAPGCNAQLADTWTAIRDMSPESMKLFMHGVGKHNIWTATVAEGDMCWVPAGYIVTEKAHAKPSVGLQARMLTKECAGPLKAIAAELGNKLPSTHVLKAALMALPPDTKAPCRFMSSSCYRFERR